MVRLKVPWAQASTFRCCGFNSTMVRLKAINEGWVADWNSSFNSTMVRLKVCAGEYYQPVNVFQFHYGSIKGPGWTFVYRSTVVSIPLWFD